MSAFWRRENFAHNSREEGIQQDGLKEITDHLTEQWVHIFPEGEVCQSSLGYALSGEGRDYLRWGIGKMAAYARGTPIIVPIYHSGMDAVMPQNEGSRLANKEASRLLAINCASR